MANLKHPLASLKRSATGIMQTLFSIAILAIFVICFLVQDEAITLPKWAKAWNGLSSEQQEIYTAVLIPVVLILALLFFFAGFALMVRERRENRANLAMAV
ncbi:uncharacterized protein F4807DRAFT_456890 [Annulohypoxylon truncatum]|uniref:uncharacterized protein n=1 Tax=Annulohypoxylon truncatum TaxID=327061 RepID=UPI00200745A7|nr:uncharacterized protein F4807DRAFT_456890 [Annulohypoxylon truncatum]KAI1213544.1 hypothetical protein F4807DRAFT_456890 [Annulohypoxylon truncatum]